MHTIIRIILASTLLLLAIKGGAETVSVEDGVNLAQVSERSSKEMIRYILSMSEYLKLGYREPAKLPRVYLVNREYIVRHEREICFFAKTDPEARACSSHIYGWTDDERRLYILRGEDVALTDGFPKVANFPLELWLEMVRMHEMVHYVQLEGSPYVPSQLPCEVEEKWEREAFLIAAQWLHSLRSADAERINVIFRGQTPHFGCGQ